MSPCRLRNAPLMARGEEEEEKRVNSAADIADITGGTGGEKDSPPAGAAIAPALSAGRPQGAFVNTSGPKLPGSGVAA